MSSKILKEFLILVGFFLLLWLAFIYIPLRPKPPEEALSIEQEQEIGDVLIESYLDDIELVRDTIVNEAVNEIYERLLSHIESTEYDYHIYVVKNENINAFASLGGNVVIFTGLLEFAETPEEVAAVLAHEMGHVEKRHVVNKVVKQLGITLVLSILGGGDAGFIHQILQQSVSTVFDRQQESEADDYSLALLEKSKIHPNSMAAFFTRLRDKYGSSNYESLEFLSSHPNTNKRIKKSLGYKTRNSFKSQEFSTIDWQKLQEAL